MYHFYREFEKDGEFSPSSFVSGIRDRLQNFFQSREKKRADTRVESFHAAKKKDWDQFLNNASRKSFVKQLGSDSRSDAKLVMHADNMNRLQTGKKVGTVQGGSKSYSIVKLRGKDRLGCTCNDWRYKRSVAKPGEVVDCKHIRQFKQMNKTAAHPTYTAQLTSLSPQEQSKLLKEEAQKAKKYGRKDFWKDPRYRAAVSLKFPKLFPGKRSWRELTDQDFDKIVRHYRKCRTDRDRYMALRMELGSLGLPKDVWRQKVRAVVGTLPVEQMNKTAADKAPRLTFITGGAGAGKSTMAKKLVDSGEFDVLIGTDTGGVVNGQYVKPPKAEREKIRNRREALALKMRAKGKRVLVEGYPRGALRYPKLLAQADDVLYLDTPMATRLFRVGKRSRERGTPMLPDLKMGLTTHFDDLKYRKEIEEKSPNFRSIRTYEDAKKEAGHVEDRIAERAPGATYEVAKIRARIPMMNLRKGQTYHVPLKGGKGYAVIGDIGPKHVVKTVLGPNMKPPGERAKIASARERRRKQAQARRDAALIFGGGYIAPRALNAASMVGMAPYMVGSPLSVDREELLRTVKEHGLRGARDEKKTIFGIPYNRNAAYDPNTHEILGDLDRYSKSVLYHEIGHGVDKGLISRLIGEKPSTLSMLRNEAVANINALKLRPGVLGKIDQAIFTVPQMAGYIGAAGARHPLISTGLSAGALYGGRALKKRRNRKKKEAQSTKTARAPRDYSREYAQYHAKPEQVANRSMRNQARRKLGLKKGDPREADHKTPISKGGGNGSANLRAVSRLTNRTKFTDKK